MEKLKEWQMTIQVVVLSAIAAVTVTQIQPDTWDRIERLAERIGSLLLRIAEDPAGALVMAAGLATFARGLWALYRHEPSKRTVKTVATVETIRSGKRDTPREGFAALDLLLFIAAGAGIALAALTLQGCPSAVPRVRSAQDVCLENEQAIIDRPGTTYEQDLEDLALERARCDAARAAAGAR